MKVTSKQSQLFTMHAHVFPPSPSLDPGTENRAFILILPDMKYTVLLHPSQTGIKLSYQHNMHLQMPIAERGLTHESRL